MCTDQHGGQIDEFILTRRNYKILSQIGSDPSLNLKSLSMAKGLAQERLALDAGVDRVVVSKTERGVTNPSLDVC